MILYEYPCNERVRTLLRVEHLFGRLFFFVNGSDVQHHQIALATLFDLLDVSERTDLRGSVLQDLERQRTALGALREHPGVDATALDDMLETINTSSSALSVQGRIGQGLRENDWLAGLRGRLTVPGGASPADIPSFYAWQIKPHDIRVADLKAWISPFMPLYEGLALILRILRDSSDKVALEASQGAYQEMLTGKTYQLLRVWVDEQLGVFPEMSANKYVIWIRFSLQDNHAKPQSATQNIPFQLARCSL